MLDPRSNFDHLLDRLGSNTMGSVATAAKAAEARAFDGVFCF